MNIIKGSGDGTRPMTDGTVDNVGAGEKFTSKRTAEGGEISGPGPKERMQDKRADVEGSKRDDSAPFGLMENLESRSNKDDPEGT